MSDNYELLEWAKYNLKEWKEEYTHLRGDTSEEYPTFFTKGEWWVDPLVRGCWFYSSGSDDWSPIFSEVKWSSPQSITKEEWLQATNPP